MEYRRFDELTRQIARNATRRAILRRLAAGAAVAGGGLVARRARSAAGGCIEADGVCRGDADCCSDACCQSACCAAGELCTGGQCCPAKSSCDDVCCPPGTVGCTKIDGPDGPIVGCLCEKGRDWNRALNLCAETPGGCPDGSHPVDGECQFCPAGTQCSGTATCGSLTTEGLCCSYPSAATCCCPGPDGRGGWAMCCGGPGDDCPPCDNGYAVGGATNCCYAETFPDCCFSDCQGGNATLSCLED